MYIVPVSRSASDQIKALRQQAWRTRRPAEYDLRDALSMADREPSVDPLVLRSYSSSTHKSCARITTGGMRDSSRHGRQLCPQTARQPRSLIERIYSFGQGEQESEAIRRIHNMSDSKVGASIAASCECEN